MPQSTCPSAGTQVIIWSTYNRASAPHGMHRHEQACPVHLYWAPPVAGAVQALPFSSWVTSHTSSSFHTRSFSHVPDLNFFFFFCPFPIVLLPLFSSVCSSFFALVSLYSYFPFLFLAQFLSLTLSLKSVISLPLNKSIFSALFNLLFHNKFAFHQNH